MLDYIEKSIEVQKRCLGIATYALENTDDPKKIEELELRIKGYKFAINRLSKYDGMKLNQYSIVLKDTQRYLAY